MLLRSAQSPVPVPFGPKQPPRPHRLHACSYLCAAVKPSALLGVPSLLLHAAAPSPASQVWLRWQLLLQTPAPPLVSSSASCLQPGFGAYSRKTRRSTSHTYPPTPTRIIIPETTPKRGASQTSLRSRVNEGFTKTQGQGLRTQDKIWASGLSPQSPGDAETQL